MRFTQETSKALYNLYFIGIQQVSALVSDMYSISIQLVSFGIYNNI